MKKVILYLTMGMFAVLGALGIKQYQDKKADFKCQNVSVWLKKQKYPKAYACHAVKTANDRYSSDLKASLEFENRRFYHEYGGKDVEMQADAHPDMMLVHVGVQEKAETTASLIVHELGHLYLHQTTGNYDAKHSNKDFWALADKALTLPAK